MMPVTRFIQSLVAGVTCLALASCATTTDFADKAHDVVRPKSQPVRNITGFTESLRCMDQLLATYVPPGPPAILYSKGVIDKTGKDLGLDNREMLMSTVSKMSARSNIFQFTDLPNSVDDAALIDANFGLDNRERAQYEIIAAISQMDENVSARSRGFDIQFLGSGGDSGRDGDGDGDGDGNDGGSKSGFNAGFGYTDDINVSIIAVDFLVSKPSNGLVLNGIDASNAIAIARSGKAGDIGGQIKKAGVSFNLSLDQSEGAYAAIRALVELSTIEILGKLAEVPYWQCLQIEQSHPEIITITQQWFSKMPQQQRVSFVQKILAKKGIYPGKIDGQIDALTRKAITDYQQSVGLIPTGRISIQLYRKLISNDAGDRVRLAEKQPAGENQAIPAAATELAVKPTVTLTTDRGPRPQYNALETLTVIAAVSQPAYLYCFYRDATSEIVKIYPNRFQPQTLVQPSTPVTIPGAPEFSLLLEQSGSSEEVVCMASPHPLDSLLPEPLAYDLESIPADSMDDIISVFMAANPKTLAQQKISISVQ